MFFARSIRHRYRARAVHGVRHREAVRGNVEVCSEVGRGTSFKIYLPRSEERAQRPTPRCVSAPPPNGQATVLLVDDDSHVWTAGRRALERAGCRVLAATTGRDGLRVAEGHPQT